jgi:hypothetical protein
MGLRNIFGAVATEDTLKQLLRVFQEGRFLPYSKDSADRMYVYVGNAPQVVNYMGNSSAGPGATNLPPWGISTGVLMDDRAEQQDFTLGNFIHTRNRWNIT